MEIQESQQSQIDRSNAISTLLKELKPASKKLLQAYSIFSTSYPPDSIVTFLNLLVDAKLSYDPDLSNLAQLILHLRSLYYKLRDHRGNRIKPLFQRQVIYYKMYKTVLAIDGEIKRYVDKEIVQNLVNTLQRMESEEQKDRVLKSFKERLNEGFDRDFQQLVLKEKASSVLESLICDSNSLKEVRENAALAVMALVEYNRDVFVGLLTMSDIVGALVSMASSCSIQVLRSLVRHVRAPLTDEIALAGQIPGIITLLSSEDLSIQVAAVDCICQIANCGRKEVIQEMLQQGLMEKLMMLERSEGGGNKMVEANERSHSDSEEIKSEEENGEFGGCVVKFAVMVETSEGLDLKEQRELKREILRKVTEASVSETEAAAVVAEVLWGSRTSL